MDFRYAISLVIEAHLPFVRDFRKEDDLFQTAEEDHLFEYISETLLPLLETFDRLEADHQHFRLSLAISPILCYLLNDEHLQKKYLSYIDKQIEFGMKEIERTADNAEMNKLAQNYHNHLVEMKTAYVERYEKNIIKAFDSYRRKGKLEILASSATHAFLPVISRNSESLNAQIEIPAASYRRYFGSCPQGFWLPSLGWTSEIEQYLRDYNFTYTVVESHSLLFGKPTPEKGTFYPVRTPDRIYVLGRDYYSVQEIKKMTGNEAYRDNSRDVGYDLPPELIAPFLNAEGERRRTGYKYWSVSENGGDTLYNPQAASDRLAEHARLFLERSIARLEEATMFMEEPPISVCALNADNFGRFWYEGPQFIETLFRMAGGYRDFMFVNPSEYLSRQELTSLQVVVPEFSSCCANGYAETWLNVSNDWIYRHLSRSMERMTELAERFPDDTGLKERALNQAAREILLAQSSDWPALLYRQDSTEFARSQAENALRNFTTIYEALGSNYISTEWLTTLERKHNLFPNINYRVFRRKK
jgi:1,4-alpha-glucan branching enzyme